MIVPGVDRLQKVSMQIITLPVPAQEGITRDNVTVRVDAVVYFKVVQPADAIIRVEDYRFAVSQMAQTSLRSIIGKSELDDLLSNREKLNQGLELMIDSPAVEWGVTVDRVEIKDVSLPETMKRSMARQAEAQRDRRARVINADAELEASRKLAQAAEQMSETPAALAAPAAADGRVRGHGEELHAGAALPRRAAALPRGTSRGQRVPNGGDGKKGNGSKKRKKARPRRPSRRRRSRRPRSSPRTAPVRGPLPPEAAFPEGPAPGAIAPPDAARTPATGTADGRSPRSDGFRPRATTSPPKGPVRQLKSSGTRHRAGGACKADAWPRHRTDG